MARFGKTLSPVVTLAKMVAVKKLTEAEASMLARALMRQMRSRFAAMKVETSAAFGKPVLPLLGVPPACVSAAILIVYTGRPKLLMQKINSADIFGAFGALSGMAKTWDAFLESPSAQTVELEEKYSVLGEMRSQLKTITASSVKAVRGLDRKFEKAHLKPALRASYMKGQGEAADAMVDDAGDLRDDGSIRSDICYFIWLYWPDIQRLSSVTQLEKFFSEMRQDGITRKNLEKVCREIGLKFKAKGRPKNLLSRKAK